MPKLKAAFSGGWILRPRVFCPQTNPQSLFGGIQMQQRGQAGMASMTGSSHPPFGVSGLQTNSIQQQAHNQFMINRQGNSISIFYVHQYI